MKFRRLMPPSVKVLFVVKGDAYGHGAARVSMEAEKSGAVDWLGVSSVEEGIAVRGAGVSLPILVLGSLYPFRESFSECLRHGLTPTVSSLEGAKNLLASVQAAGRRSLRRRFGCHLKVDTGMGRIGVSPQEAARIADFLAGQTEAALSGVYTHFSKADSDRTFTLRQCDVFQSALSSIRMKADETCLRHAANSVAALRYPRTRFDMVRPGLALYGLYGSFEPVLSLKSRIVFLKEVPRGTAIGYGGDFKTRRRSRIATIPVGYADGVSRRLGEGGGQVLVRGKSLPIVGRMSMDMLTVDATESPQTRVGDEVVLIGASGRARITAEDVARLCQTISYETVVSISKRVPRVYRP